jgi:hypothetical protein
MLPMPSTSTAGCRLRADATPLERVRFEAAANCFEPLGAIRCDGPRLFRTQAARDAGCLADLDPAVRAWRCLPLALGADGVVHVPDLAIELDAGVTLVDAVDDGAAGPPDWVPAAVAEAGFGHRVDRAADLRGHRLDNARDLLRYARWRVSLGDRVRLLTLLEESGPLPLASCLGAVRSSEPIGTIAALALRGFVRIDLDDGPIGPATRVRAAS